MFFAFRTSLRNLRKHNKNILYCRSIYLMSFSLYYVQHFKSLFPFYTFFSSRKLVFLYGYAFLLTSAHTVTA